MVTLAGSEGTRAEEQILCIMLHCIYRNWTVPKLKEADVANMVLQQLLFFSTSEKTHGNSLQ